jgi:hypothetical protein
MSVRDVHWTPADGGPGRDVPACSACAHKVDQGIEPDMRKVEVDGAPVSYVNAGFAPAYWGASASARACSPVSCSARRSPPTPSLATVITR